MKPNNLIDYSLIQLPEQYFDKTMFYIKENVTEHEYKMHKYVYDLNIVDIPKIIYYNENNNLLILEKINNLSVSDCYGDKPKNVDEDIFCKVREIIKKLYDNNIVYPDITGYNFIEYDNKLWIIDFEHSYFRNDITNKEKNKKYNSFIQRFLKGVNKWNPYFK